MAEFVVSWTIDAQASTPHEAAEYARTMQQTGRPGYWCGVFSVVNKETGEVHEIDLDAEDDTVLELTDTED